MIKINKSGDIFDYQKCNALERWGNYFPDHEFEEHEGCLYIDDRLMEFEFVKVIGAKSLHNGNYVLVSIESVEVADSSDEDRDDPNDMFYIIRFNDLTKPGNQGPGKPLLPKPEDMTFDDYMQQHSGTSFTRQQLDQWVEEGKIQIEEPETATDPF